MAKSEVTSLMDGVERPFDGLWELVDCYEALQLLAFDECGHGTPVPTLLHNLNRQLRRFLDEASHRGLVS